LTSAYNGSDKRLQYLYQNAKNVGFTQTLGSGTKIGEISIDGVSTNIYAPSGGTPTSGGSVDYEDIIGSQITVPDEYVLTEDTTVVSGKDYYSYNISTHKFTPVTPSGNENPHSQGWYEASILSVSMNTYQVGKLSIWNGGYVQTSDTVVDSHKTYYSYNSGTGEYTAVTPSGNENPSQQGWYEEDVDIVPVHTPPAFDVSYQSTIQSGVRVGILTVKRIRQNPNDEDEPYIDYQNTYDVYAPSGGGGNVDDVMVNGASVVDSSHVARIDLTPYATDTELATAVAGLQASFQDGVDRIYEACVRKGSTPASHSLTDVIAAIYAISGSTPIVYEEVDSEVEVIPEFTTTVEVQ
jgi:hypothetical protein